MLETIDRIATQPTQSYWSHVVYCIEKNQKSNYTHENYKERSSFPCKLVYNQYKNRTISL